MNVPDIIIAVDGCSSTGKSSFARLVAEKFGFTYLDSGAMYRGVTLFAQEEGLIDASGVVSSALEGRLEGLDLHFGQGNRLYLGPRCIGDEIRSMEVSSQVSHISAIPQVRAYVDGRLHGFASGGRVVMDGRDIGTTVFPGAELKIFMTATLEVRARRRYEELLSKGSAPALEEVMRNLEERDYMDSHRETSPLRKADDAFVLDNSEMTIGEELAWVQGLVRGKFGINEG